jgi:hypothetical protein
MSLSTAQSAVLSIGGAVSLVSLAPEYSLLHSYTWTAITLFAFIFFYRVFYALILYPSFFTPLKHLPQPSVSATRLPSPNFV